MDDWLYKNFLKRTTLEKANKYYQKILGSLHNTLFTQDKQSVDDLMSYNLEYRVIASIMYGYKLNAAWLNSSNKYNTSKVNDVNISKDSFLTYFRDMKKEVVYHELFTSGGRTDMIIVSYVSAKCKKLIELIK